MRTDTLRLASDLAQRGEPFALVTVVRREAPSSARVGDAALITQGGAFHGWLGGSCTQSTAVREALAALHDGVSRLIALSADPEAETRPGVIALPMTCHGGGSVDLFIEPVLPAPRLLIFGVSPAARALARLGGALGYRVEAIDPDADQAAFPEADRVWADLKAPEFAQSATGDSTRVYAVVATLGQYDEEAIRMAIALSPAYLGVVASRKRFAQLRDVLAAQDVSSTNIDAICTPAGLDIGAVTPEEIAVSILAEIVQQSRARRGADFEPDSQAVLPEHAGLAENAAPAEQEGLAEHEDPVCGMPVNADRAQHTAEFSGRTYYFCCGGCRKKFLKEPDTFVAASAAGETS